MFQNPDIEQIKLELIDIWHFGMSMLLTEHGMSEELAITIGNDLENPELSGTFLEAVEALAGATLTTKTFPTRLFAGCLKAANMSTDSLYRGYIGKNVLNFFKCFPSDSCIGPLWQSFGRGIPRVESSK